MNSLVDAKTGEVIFGQLALADTFAKRSLGLLGRTELGDDEALLIRPCSSIHTWFMRMEITAAFCDAQGTVLRIADCVRPWRVVLGPKGTTFVVEMAANPHRLSVGQQVCPI